MAMATAVLASHLRVGADSVRERVEAAVVGALQGVEVAEVPPGSSAEELLEQVALHAAMDFMFGELHPAFACKRLGRRSLYQASSDESGGLETETPRGS